MTKTEVVVDASILLKLVLEEPDTPACLLWYEMAIEARTRFMAPASLYAETGRVVQRRFPELTPEERQLIHSDLLADIELLPPQKDADWHAARHLEFFDALYVAAAKGRSLVTADARMAKAAQALGVALVRLPDVTSEASAPSTI